MNVIAKESGLSQSIIVSLSRALIVAGLLFWASDGRAQLLQADPEVNPSQPDSIVQVTAEAEGLTQIAPEDLPPCGTFWEVMPSGIMAPLPCPPFDLTLPIYGITDNIFLVDATGGAVSVNPRLKAVTSSSIAAAVEAQGNAIADLIEQVQESELERTMVMAFGLDVPSPGDGSDGGTNTLTPNGLGFALPDYGTNLWIAQTVVSNGWLNAIGTNTLPLVKYEIQTLTNLCQTNWQFENFIYGSSDTNWTPLSVAQNGRTNLFIRLKSWADDGSGLPVWWQQQYFGTNGVDPYGNPAGDGWSNYQKFQRGWNPNNFYTPAAPSGFSVGFYPAVTARVQWQAGAGAVVGYQVEKTYELHAENYSAVYSTNVFNVSSNDFSLDDDVSGETSDDYFAFDAYNDYYKVRAQYANGQYSDWSAKKPLKTAFLSASLVFGAGGQAYLTISGAPADTTKIRLFYQDDDAISWGQTPINFSNDIPYSAFANGIYALPDSLQPPAQDTYGHANWGYNVFAQSVNASNKVSGTCWFFQGNGWKKTFYDGRVQLKQNLIFKLRAAGVDKPFKFYYSDPDNYYDYVMEFFDPPTNHVASSILHVTDALYDPEYFNPYDYYAFHSTLFDPQLPFFENYLYNNFVYRSANVTSEGLLNTGVENYTTDNVNYGLGLSSTPSWKFQAPSGTWTNATGLLDASSTGWLCSIPLYNQYGTIYSLHPQLYENEVTYSNGVYSLASGAVNLYGLPISTEKLAAGKSGGNVNVNISPGSSYALSSYNSGPVLYAGPAQPNLQTVEYDIWNAMPVWNETLARWVEDWLPGSQHFSPTNQSQTMFVPVGSSVQIAGYAKMELQNGYSGVYAYLGQYFDYALKVDANGVVTTNRTGIVSPYGDLFAAEAGPIALVTMPDVDTGLRGTNMVYCVNCIVDRSQGSNMNLSFSGANTTSQANPATIWVNNNYDRGHTVDGNDFEQDDLGAADISKLPAYQQVPDCNYVNAYAQPCIPGTRDLEDYFRLWLPGVAGAMRAMPANYTVKLTLSGDAQIRVFQAYESDGGTNYLFDATTASNQVANSASLYVGPLTAASPLVLPLQTNFNEHFIFCGVHIGSAKLDLQILDGNGNTIADAPVYLQINDIKQMYERWTVGETPGMIPKTMPDLDSSDLTNLPISTVKYSSPTDTSTPYILLVHGWNMERWEKDRFAETAFKRLYWQGYQGRFGIYRWPTGNKFDGSFGDILTDARNYDNSELTAWRSATGLTNLLTQLNTNYPGHVYLMAHSMGNVVAGEALNRASSQLVNTYIAMQGAVPSHTYDPNTTTRVLGYLGTFDSGTPNRYANYYTAGAPCYFNSSAGAGVYVNFYNTNDYALDKWTIDQNYKPDNGTAPGYHYSSSSGFYRIMGTGPGSTTYLSFPADTYEIFAYGDEARCFALGAQVDVGGAFAAGSQTDLQTLWPEDTHSKPKGAYSGHVWHSGQFRDDFPNQARFWGTLLGRNGFNLK